MGILALFPSGKAEAQTFINTPFVISNQSTYSADDIWVSFTGSIPDNGTPQTVGDSTFSSTSTFQTYQLSSMLGTVAGVSQFNGTQAYTFSLNDYVGGRIYISYGAPLTAAPIPGDPGTTPYSVVEMTVQGQVTAGVDSSNIDVSYVDGVSQPVSTSIMSDTGTPLAATSINPVTTAGNILSNVVSEVPSGAVVMNGNTPVRVISSAQSPAYHDWTALMTTLETTTATNPLIISSYTAPSDTTSSLQNALFGYSGAPPIAGQAPGFQTAQSYNMAATFTTDLNPGGNNAALTAAGITAGTAGVVMTGSGSVSGNFSIYVTAAQLNAQTGIYGSNPNYVVLMNGVAYPATTGIMNDLGGRIVGDLMAGIVFGWSNSTMNVGTYAAMTGLNLYGASFSSKNINQLSSGELFYLLSLAGAQGQLSKWIGGAIDPNFEDYDQYTAAIAQNSDAYGTGFGDRLQGALNPNTYWYTANPPTNPDTGEPYDTVGYVEITLGSTSVPEPSAYALFALGGLMLWGWRRRMSMTRD